MLRAKDVLPAEEIVGDEIVKGWEDGEDEPGEECFQAACSVKSCEVKEEGSRDQEKVLVDSSFLFPGISRRLMPNFVSGSTKNAIRAPAVMEQARKMPMIMWILWVSTSKLPLKTSTPSSGEVSGSVSPVQYSRRRCQRNEQL